MKRHTHSHTHGERILIDEIAYASALRRFLDVENFCVPV